MTDKEVLGYFRSFCYAATITWATKYKQSKERQSGCKRGRSRKNCHLQRMYQLPNLYLAKILQIDHTTIIKYRTAAAKAGYIKIAHYFKAVGLPAQFLPRIKYTYPENRNCLVLVRNQIHWQLPCFISSYIHLSTSRKLRQLFRTKHPP
ncbi:hypothetical protein EMN47_14005 [Prolixibacteraceae bacterium JC049]|nr:hypothetical protein [Prolixibacteraceae bacterium JC049]